MAGGPDINDWLTDPSGAAKKWALEAAKEEAEAKLKAGKKTVKDAAKGAVKKVKEMVNWSDPENVPFEPEVLQPYRDAGLREEQRNDALGRSITYYIYKGAEDGVIEYAFKERLYSEQITFFENKLNDRNRPAMRYTKAVESLKKRFKTKQTEYDTGKSMETSRNLGIARGSFQPGDAMDDQLAPTDGDRAAFGAGEDTYVYSGWITDIDKKDEGSVYHSDLRTLVVDYMNRADAADKELKDKLDRTKDAKEDVTEAYEEYLEQLED